jgi:hypothetical protein
MPFVDVAQNAGWRHPPLVSVGITNRDKRAGSQRHFPTMIDAGF